MREIKFRYWRKEDNKIETQVILNLPCLADTDLMQYTGLKDKNGKEIYEGDLVNFIGAKNPGEVIFNNGAFEIDGFWNNSQDEPARAFSENATLEIIGNIYENPELLTNPELEAYNDVMGNRD